MEQTVLIDGDITIYTSAILGTETEEFFNGETYKNEDLGVAIKAVRRELDYIIETTGADKFLVCLSAENNFRKYVSKEYKANRKDKEKPKLIKPLRQWVMDNLPHRMLPVIEADDVMGIMASDPDQREGMIVWSKDKDMKTVPCRLYDQKTNELLNISEEEADRYWWTQTLTGDAVDGYKGIPGCGPAKAKKILDNDCSWSAVVEAYEAKGLTLDDAVCQARMARILRHGDYDEKLFRVKLWKPNGYSEPT